MKLIFQKRKKNPSPDMQYCARSCVNRSLTMSFYHILRDANTQATITGLVRLKCANEYVAPLKRQVSTWNSMVEKNKQFVEWAMSNDCPFDVKITKNLLTPINAFNL